MLKSSVHLHTLPSGLRLVHLYIPGSAVGYCGADVLVGSRDEDAATHGLAHFVEHTIFKGTSRRSSWHIINRMEAIGGELNAYTTKEETVVYTAFPRGNLARAAELIADLITSSTFPAAQLDKEREVVADEIDSYLDSPADAVFDDFEDLAFRGTSLGHNILGTREALDTFSPELCREYLHRWYVPSNMVIFSAGPTTPERTFRTLERAFESKFGAWEAPERPASTFEIQDATFSESRALDTHQAHTVLGTHIPGYCSDMRYPIALYSNIIGGPGMNSLLNVALRERRGLVYTVEASTGLYSDCGLLTVYYGCDPDDNARCDRLVRSTLAELAEHPISVRRLDAAKKQYIGQMILARQNLENRILSIARQALLLGRVIAADESLDAIRSVSPATIASLAALPLSRLTLGPEE